ncbi:MAG: hypothetical protein A2481_02010 [Candidatus Yonathbacteria bacterium RIFOXYC2_FULL_47_9]|nr:MAG: hypothetical protein A2481_02010 [Candidatus Yonathbacteria bacterium RIFOXYC2_FULL_47_9]HAT68013.1 hypothetical protein [Candidatus Yonathbacteria bacterium]
MTKKRLAVIAGGWHFPLAFFEQIAAQKIPEGWEVDMFVVSHRDPAYALAEKKDVLPNLGYDRRGLFDRLLYHKVATVAEIEALGWNYVLEPNTVGDWGNTNQWLEKNDYKKYDKFLITHDDNFILTNQMFMDILPQEDWLILTNSTGNAQRRLREWLHLPKKLSLRGSFEFFTREMFDLMGGKFDLSETTLTREGETNTTGAFSELSDWNTTVFPLQHLIEEKSLQSRIKALSLYYRMSRYCLEGERGYIHKTEKSNTKEEEKGLDMMEKYYREHKKK